jgi:hypothetical protein
MRQTAVAVLALAAFSCFPGSAGAKVGHGRPPVEQWIDIELEGSNGYSISGTGTLARTPESVFTWGDDLSVQLPGLDPDPLGWSRLRI